MAEEVVALRIKFYGILRDEVGNASIPFLAEPGETVGHLLHRITDRYPRLHKRIFAPDGTIQPFVMISLNGVDTRHAGGLATLVSQNDDLLIFPPGAGG